MSRSPLLTTLAGAYLYQQKKLIDKALQAMGRTIYVSPCLNDLPPVNVFPRDDTKAAAFAETK